MNLRTILGLSRRVLPPLAIIAVLVLNQGAKCQTEKGDGPDDEVCLMAVGDMMLSRYVDRKMQRLKDFQYPFAMTQDLLRRADLVFGNLECPITPGRTINNLEMVFRADPAVAKALKEAGFTIVSLANNHTLNFGPKGLTDTLRYLQEAEVKTVGAGENLAAARAPVYLERKGQKFAFLAYQFARYQTPEDSPGVAGMDLEEMLQDVQEARSQADFVIVSMHAGGEYAANPNLMQVTFAHAAIDAGADLVLGHHPHVVQKIEEYNQKFIFYSLGNFIFDQKDQKAREGLMAKVIFAGKEIKSLEAIPVVIKGWTTPEIAEGPKAAEILKRSKIHLIYHPAVALIPSPEPKSPTP
jgi:poly-gamma-glutamate capsule biosynthesis protein CapA/YwtB (metallophosphatase superfamily)